MDMDNKEFSIGHGLVAAMNDITVCEGCKECFILDGADKCFSCAMRQAADRANKARKHGEGGVGKD